MQQALLDSAHLKVDRANQHANALKATIERWLEDRPYSISFHAEGDTGQQAFLIHIEREPPPEWSVVIGEAVYNLRSALDHAVYALSSLDGDPPDGTEFPIFKDCERFESTSRPGGRWKARGLRQDALAVVESVQPFHHGQDPEIHPLWVLQEFSNIDKHRTLNTTGGVFGTRNLKLSPSGDIRIKNVEIRGDGPVTDGAELARWSVEGTQGQVQMEGEIAYDVAFDEAGPGKQEPVRNGLDLLGTTVKSILRMLAEAV